VEHAEDEAEDEEALTPGPLPPGPPAGTARQEDEGPFDPAAVLASLRALIVERSSLDERLRRACLLMRRTAAWRWTPYRDYTIWCAEGLGISPRTIRQHVALEKRLQELPPLREAVRSRLLTLEQAREVARHATPEDVAARIEQAAGRPVIAVRREADDESDRRMWDVSTLSFSLPERVAQLLRDALRAGRHHFPGLDPGEIVVCIAAHFNLTWKPDVDRILKATDKVILRDRWLCQIPGCSRPAEHVHHVWFRSKGGPDEKWNLLGLCAAHHLHGVHAGYIELTGRAPDGLTFVIGEEAVRRARTTRNGAPDRWAA
jgi:hypothetical protein